ncbi:ribonuclease HII [Desulfobulbus rhabdoformis]|uniref:ribonuclease HII n=1 Tax=Desulfobulbus rhabdoformis TaxID=34032 RepID=UPI001965BC53|nr:ribonuclease HII [Desulfobulbus rhabdoformis]MBM9612748.1 ribonuclease HII [Desulfobulbus rhabdoformis]
MNQDVLNVLPDPQNLPDTFALERALLAQGFARVAGVDEAGRGPLAGPVVAGCVVLAPSQDTTIFFDSKTLTARRRELLFAELMASPACVGIGIADAREIESLNILQASLLAMRRAVDDCQANGTVQPPDFLLVDGKFKVPLPLTQLPLVKGESKSSSIAAASIVAKVTRDRLMQKAHELYPVYGFNRHQGYPTKAHREALQLHGPCELHRRTFRGVAELVEKEPVSPPDQKGLW